MPEAQELNLKTVTELANYRPEYVTLMVPTNALEELAKILKGIILDAEAISHDADNDDVYSADDVYDLISAMGDVARNIEDKANEALRILREVFGA
jgi:hypothetical protein